MAALFKHSKLRISDSDKERNNLIPFLQKLVRAGQRKAWIPVSTIPLSRLDITM